jgi:hypothetical protein
MAGITFIGWEGWPENSNGRLGERPFELLLSPGPEGATFLGVCGRQAALRPSPLSFASLERVAE